VIPLIFNKPDQLFVPAGIKTVSPGEALATVLLTSANEPLGAWIVAASNRSRPENKRKPEKTNGKNHGESQLHGKSREMTVNFIIIYAAKLAAYFDIFNFSNKQAISKSISNIRQPPPHQYTTGYK
jgi:hypothetical protein